MIEELVGWFRNPILLLLRNLYACEWFSFRVNSKAFQFPHEQNFDQTGVYHGIGLLLPFILPRHIVICNRNIKKFSFWSQAT